MNHLNSVIVEGNLTRDPEFKTSPNGTKICLLSIAVNRAKKNADGERANEVSFFCVETFGKVAENCARYCQKGRGVRVVGRMKQSRWTGQDGKSMSKISILAEHVEFKPMLKNFEPKEDFSSMKEANEAAYEQENQGEELEAAVAF